MTRLLAALHRRRARGDRGAVIIEFAVVIPIFMMLVLGLADFALAELSDTAGSNAAREGARVGILYYDGANTAGSTNHDRISDAVRSKLAGNVKGAPTVAVRCLTPSNVPKTCTSTGADKVVAGRDLIEVSVTWTRRGGITGLIGSGTRTDKAVMRIVGTPPTGSAGPAPACTITAASATPNTVVRDAAGSIPSVTFNVSVSDRAACGGVDLAFPAESGLVGPQTMTETSPGGTDFDLVLAAGGTWSSGPKDVGVSSNGGAATTTISFVVESPTVCGLTPSTPVTANQSAGKLTAPATFNVTVSSVAACGTPTLTFPAAAGYGGPQAMTPAGGNVFTFTIPTTQGTWTSQTYTVGVAGNNGATASISFVVSSTPVCTLSNLTVSPSTAPAKDNGQEDIQTDVTIRVTRSSTTVCDPPTVQVTPGPSGQNPSLTSAQTMHDVGATTGACTGLTCEWVIKNKTPAWGPGPSQRTVAVASSGSTLTATLSIT